MGYDWKKIEEIEKRLMTQLGYPDSHSHKTAFDQFANELFQMFKEQDTVSENTVDLFLKHDDRANISFKGATTDGYIPHVNDVLGGDLTELSIDNDTGKIIWWTPIHVVGGRFEER